MCGIAGMIHLDGKPISSSSLKAMTDAISHRGPDGEGQWIDDAVGIGHRRLAIVDLSEMGKQPMTSKTGRFVMSYNGEIYNFKELRSELLRLGYEFNSQTDSEVFLQAFEEWGISAFDRINGMFAVAFWDRQEKQLTLARDRYGIKPLYVARQGSLFCFASEQKAILTNPKFNRRLDCEALYEYLTFQNIFTNRSLMSDITILPAGSCKTLTVKANGNIQSKLTQYWNYDFREPIQTNGYQESVEQIEFLFRNAVKRHLIGDVEIGSYLSGGMDSGSITAIASESLCNMKTFTCGFDLSSASGNELNYDERKVARSVSTLLNTDHHEYLLKPEDMQRSLPKLAYHLEEPRVGQSYPNFYAAQLASNHVKVVLSGAGGDELFAGYPWRYYRAIGTQGFEDYVDRYFQFWQRLTNSEERKKIFSPIYDDVKHVDPREIFKSVLLSFHEVPRKPEDYINQSLAFEAKTFLHGLFVVEDKLSMAHGLETRVPFMDNDLVDYAMRCPVSLKLNNLSNVVNVDENDLSKAHKYFQKTSDGKQILRDMMSKYVPREITQAPKQGFSSPDSSWFKGDSVEFVRDQLFDRNATIYSVLDYKNTCTIIEKHLNGDENRRLLIWSLLNVSEYLKQVRCV